MNSDSHYCKVVPCLNKQFLVDQLELQRMPPITDSIGNAWKVIYRNFIGTVGEFTEVF